MNLWTRIASLALLALLMTSGVALAQSGDEGAAADLGDDPTALTDDDAADDDAAALAKQSQNPVGNLISLPLQNNMNIGQGNEKETANILNVQPVIPISVGKFNLINRLIVPISSQPGDPDRTTGIGDTTLTTFISPAEPGKLIWGVGPVFYFPTATDDALGINQWGLGPSVILLGMPGPWVVGGLFSHVFQVEDDREQVGPIAQPELNLTTVQIISNLNYQGGWFLTSTPIITYNWDVGGSEAWTIPLGGGVGRVFGIGKRPVNSSLQFYWNAQRPQFAAEYQLRFQFTLLFPKKPKG